MIDKKILIDRYADWSKSYDKDKNAGIYQIIPVIIDLLKNENTGTGLDLGCGTGLLTLKVAEYSDKVIGIDLSNEMLSVAEQKVKSDNNIVFIKGDITKKLDFIDEYFDYIVSSLAICHVDDLIDFYGEIKRVLKPNGVLIFGDVFSKLNCRFEQLSHKDHFENYRNEKTKVWNMYPLEKHLDALRQLGLFVENIVETKIDNSLHGILSNEDIERNKGCVFCVVVKARKENLIS